MHKWSPISIHEFVRVALYQAFLGADNGVGEDLNFHARYFGQLVESAIHLAVFGETILHYVLNKVPLIKVNWI